MKMTEKQAIYDTLSLRVVKYLCKGKVNVHHITGQKGPERSSGTAALFL
jgi:hypothetical protein